AVALAYAVYEGSQKSFLGGIFPTLAGVAGLVAVLFVMVPQARNAVASAANYDSEANRRDAGMWPVIAWLFGLVAGVALVGFVIAIALFFVFFMRRIAGLGWARSLIMTAIAIAGMLVLANALNLVFPGGLLQSVVRLPWPLR